MDWGKGIFWSLAGFVIVSVIGYVVIVFSQKDDLVESDYYERELRYEQQIEAIRNFDKLSDKPKIDLNQQIVGIALQQGSGKAEFLNLKSAKLDTVIEVSSQKTAFITLSKGKWRLRLLWTHEGKSYYQEQGLIISD